LSFVRLVGQRRMWRVTTAHETCSSPQQSGGEGHRGCARLAATVCQRYSGLPGWAENARHCARFGRHCYSCAPRCTAALAWLIRHGCARYQRKAICLLLVVLSSTLTAVNGVTVPTVLHAYLVPYSPGVRISYYSFGPAIHNYAPCTW